VITATCVKDIGLCIVGVKFSRLYRCDFEGFGVGDGNKTPIQTFLNTNKILILHIHQ